MLSTSRLGPLTYLDEVSALLIAVPYPHYRPSRPRDSEYGLLTGLIEVESWLESGPNNDQAPGDRHSLAGDVALAMERPGPAVSRRLAAAGALVAALHSVAEGGQKPGREPVRSSFAALRRELCDPGTILAAFDDILDAARDPGNSHLVLETRIAVFTEVLDLTDRTAAEIGRILGGVLDDQALEISIARHGLDGTPILNPERPDETAGLSEDDRLALGRRYLQRPARAGHHVVWVAYDNARVAGESWREQVGIVEFFDGPTLLRAHRDPDSVALVRPLPEELLMPDGPGGRDIDFWPSQAEDRSWVAARVDLGIAQLSNPIGLGRAQAEAIVQLAVFEDENSTWIPLAGVLHLVDGRHYGSERFHTPDDIQHQVRVQNDSTARGLAEVAASISAHLPVNDLALRRLLQEIGTLNASMRSGDPNRLLDDIRVVEFVTGQNRQPPSTWPEFLYNNLSTWFARSQLIEHIYQAVREVLDAFVFPDAPHLSSHAIWDPRPDGQALFKRKAALDLVPELLPRLPEHHHAARRLRDVARHLQDLAHLETWIDEIISEYKIKINRAERFRNGLTHGGAAPADVGATVRLLLHRHARVVARTMLEAVVAGNPIKQTFDAYRSQNRKWRQHVPAAADICDALFDTPERHN
jgi:hypothetical protein